METETLARLLRSARAMSRTAPTDFASAFGVGVATLKRVEAGYPASHEVRERLSSGLRRAGFEIVGPKPRRPDVALGILLLANADIDPVKPRKQAVPPSSRRLKKGPFTAEGA